jgi:hypothetical protein
MTAPTAPNSATQPCRTFKEKRQAVALLKKLKRGDDLRRRKTRRLRGAVRAHRYESELKLIIAIEKLLADLQRWS